MSDNLERLARALYGRKPTAQEYLGGADAKILQDAADRIETAEKWAAWARQCLDLAAAGHDVTLVGSDSTVMRKTLKRACKRTDESAIEIGSCWQDDKFDDGDFLRVERFDPDRDEYIDVRWLTGGAEGQLHPMQKSNLLERYKFVEPAEVIRAKVTEIAQSMLQDCEDWHYGKVTAADLDAWVEHWAGRISAVLQPNEG